MKKELFLEMLKDASTKIDYNKMEKQIKRTMDPDPISIGKPGTRNLIIVIEELAELQEVILDIRKQAPVSQLSSDNALHLQEELGDVIMAMIYVQFICEISDAELSDKMKVLLEEIQPYQNEEVLQILLTGQMTLTKYLRGSEKVTKDSVAEKIVEILDVCCFIMSEYDVLQDDVNRAMNVKLKRLENTENIYR